MEGSALAVRGAEFEGNRQGKQRPWCEYCRKSWHTHENCWKLHGKLANGKTKQGSIVPVVQEIKKVNIADVSFATVVGKGLVPISQTITLKDVLHVPTLTYNLLSISKFTHDHNCKANFCSSHCEFQNLTLGKMIGDAKQDDGLYLLNEGSIIGRQDHKTFVVSQAVYKALQNSGIKAGIYHGQMGSNDREMSLRSFIGDEIQVMVATVAFGMGIDKPNIRCVIHYGCPKDLESYYQESGRCGRDGLASVCLLYYSRSDFYKVDFYCGEAQSERRNAIKMSLAAAEKYCLLATCRRKYLLQYFGEENTDDCGEEELSDCSTILELLYA
ncbi:hypothetical protein ZIOFF_031856 [Zingiber officinale]|uniref:DNA 3'-5' helicase n=1 Tax=Zingiber officinale TaxID=94328 RepID=A0A8J5GHB5_ZINOF|nr:hypothetical protein ZIOFF_031856 [Zingiber officinale]